MIIIIYYCIALKKSNVYYIKSNIQWIIIMYYEMFYIINNNIINIQL